MQPFQQRVIDERAALDEKLGKLDAFIASEGIHARPADEQARLNKQSGLMLEYYNVLSDRIAAFTRESGT